MPLLSYLNASHNGISKTSGLRHNVALEHVDLSYNEVEHIEGLEGLQQLHTLNLSECEMQFVEGVRPLALNPSMNTLMVKGSPVAKELQKIRPQLRNLFPGINFVDLPATPKSIRVTAKATGYTHAWKKKGSGVGRGDANNASMSRDVSMSTSLMGGTSRLSITMRTEEDVAIGGRPMGWAPTASQASTRSESGDTVYSYSAIHAGGGGGGGEGGDLGALPEDDEFPTTGADGADAYAADGHMLMHDDGLGGVGGVEGRGTRRSDDADLDIEDADVSQVAPWRRPPNPIPRGWMELNVTGTAHSQKPAEARSVVRQSAHPLIRPSGSTPGPPNTSASELILFVTSPPTPRRIKPAEHGPGNGGRLTHQASPKHHRETGKVGLALKNEVAKRIPKKKAGVGGCFASEDHDVSIANLSMSRSMSKGSPKKKKTKKKLRPKKMAKQSDRSGEGGTDAEANATEAEQILGLDVTGSVTPTSSTQEVSPRRLRTGASVADLYTSSASAVSGRRHAAYTGYGVDRRSVYIRQERERQKELERAAGVERLRLPGHDTTVDASRAEAQRESPSEMHTLNTWATDASQILTMTAPVPRGDGRGIGLNGTLPDFPVDHEQGYDEGQDLEQGHKEQFGPDADLADLATLGSLPDPSTFLRPPSSYSHSHLYDMSMRDGDPELSIPRPPGVSSVSHYSGNGIADPPWAALAARAAGTAGAGASRPATTSPTKAKKKKAGTVRRQEDVTARLSAAKGLHQTTPSRERARIDSASKGGATKGRGTMGPPPNERGVRRDVGGGGAASTKSPPRRGKSGGGTRSGSGRAGGRGASNGGSDAEADNMQSILKSMMDHKRETIARIRAGQ